MSTAPDQGAKEYLGDGAYVCVEHGALVLTVENGTRVVPDRVVLEPEVYAALLRYVARNDPWRML